MSRSARVRRFFGDADHEFQLGIAQCEELQELGDCGLMLTMARLEEIRVGDIKAVLRLGLVGAGSDKEAAFRLVERHVRPGYLAESAEVALKVVSAVIAGVADEPLGEPKGEWSETLSPEARSATASSTGRAPRSASRRGKSGGARSGSSKRPSPAG